MTKEKLEEIKKDYPKLYELMTIEGRDISVKPIIQRCIEYFLYIMGNKDFRFQIRESSPYVRIIAYHKKNKRYDFEFYYRKYPSDEIMGVKFGKGDLVLNAKGNFSIRTLTPKNDDETEEGKYIFERQLKTYERDIYMRFIKLISALLPYINVSPDETIERQF